MFYYLYKVTNKINNKIYIGVHKTQNMDDGYMGSGKALLLAFRHYGKENFEKTIISEYNTEEEMFAAEADIVTEEFVLRKDTYNIKLGGCGGWSHVNSNISDEIIEKRAAGLRRHYEEAGTENRSGANNPFFGKTHNEQTKKQISEQKKEFYANGGAHPKGYLGKQHTEETKKQISERLKTTSSLIGKTGDLHPSSNTKWFNNGVDHIRSKESPGVGWVEGRIFKERKKRKIQ
jgi:group I intron endonuclease